MLQVPIHRPHRQTVRSECGQTGRKVFRLRGLGSEGNYHSAVMSPHARLRLRLLATCLALGAAINIVVAWACVLAIDPWRVTLHVVDQTNDEALAAAELDELRVHPRATHFSDDELMVGIEREIGCERRFVFISAYWNVAIASTSTRPTTQLITNDLAARVRAGWPALALSGERTMREGDIDARICTRVDG